MRQFGVRDTFDANNTEIGYQRFIETSPDIVFIDWGPDFDGIMLTKKIRSGGKSENPWVAVIVCTAYTEKYRIIEARDGGVTEFLAKPVSAKSIYSRIVSAIDDPRSFVHSNTFNGPDRRRKNIPYPGEERRQDWCPMKTNKQEKIRELARSPLPDSNALAQL